jgi:hypothetical protein
MPKITVIKPADFQTLRHTEVKKSPATKWPYFVPFSQVVRPVMLALLMTGRCNEERLERCVCTGCINISQLLFIILIYLGTNRREVLTERVPKDSKFCLKC